MNTKISTITKIAIFKGKEIRKVIFQKRIWLSDKIGQLVKHIDFDVVKSDNILNFKVVYCGINP